MVTSYLKTTRKLSDSRPKTSYFHYVAGWKPVSQLVLGIIHQRHHTNPFSYSVSLAWDPTNIYVVKFPFQFSVNITSFSGNILFSQAQSALQRNKNYFYGTLSFFVITSPTTWFPDLCILTTGNWGSYIIVTTSKFRDHFVKQHTRFSGYCLPDGNTNKC